MHNRTDKHFKGLKCGMGFSLVELMITLAIIGIIGAVAIPIYKNYVSAARHSKAQAMLMQLPVLLEQYRAESLTGSLCPTPPCTSADNVLEKTGTPQISAFLTSFDPVLSQDGIDYEYQIVYDDTDDNATLTATLKRSGTQIDQVTCFFPSGVCN
jgi:prepilin-type N-terminal cleavage/methylation domain-containing protein